MMYKVKRNIFLRIPVLDTSTQVLDLSLNAFGEIGESVFRDRNLLNLQKIFLHQCGIRMVVGRCFEGITNLVEVYNIRLY